MLDHWWKPKGTNLFVVLYAVVLVTGLPFPRALALVLPSVLTIAGIGTFGHLVNDWFDRAADAAVGKANRLATRPSWQRRMLLAAAGALALLPWIALPSDASSAALLLLELALLIAYAVPPIRLKGRRIAPISADAAYAYVVPAILAAHTFFLAAAQPTEPVFVAALTVWQAGLGVRHFLNHLALDRRNDLATRTSTLATRKGNAFLHRVIRRVVLPVELAGLVGLLLALGRAHWLLPATVGLLFLASFVIHLGVTVGRRFPLTAYRFSRTALDRFYQELLPVVFLSFLIAIDARFSALLAAHLLLFETRIPYALARVALAGPAVLTLHAARASGARPAAAPVAFVRSSCAAGSTVAPVAIAIANINKHKYTETFVHGPIPKLHYAVYFLHGGELPRFDDDDRHFLSNWPSVQALARLLESLFRLEPDYFLKNSIASYLQAKRVRLVLAHFGPVGARIAPIARDLGIPLIVWFHGYDVFHRETLREYAAEYGALFLEADRIIAVSELMMARLGELGAPEDKLVHLPAFVDLDRFQLQDRRAIGPRFLAVGRFAESKGPHLTLLAFERVVRVVPEARLTMVGKGGGGELFEACVILTRALGLEGQVEFKGVLGHDEVAEEMRRARVFVQHSVTTPEHGDMEGKPVAVMEAMAAGLPVVSTRHSGIAELIEDGVTGLLVEELDVEAMAEAMIRLATDDEAVARIGRSASARIHDDPLIGRHIAVLEDIISTSLARSGGGPP